MLSKSELSRYSRHLALPGIGTAGQLKLKNGRVLVIGAGGLGCPVLQYLVAAGVGTIGIADGDVVSLSNLQRQVLYGTEDIGKPKVAIAKQKLFGLNPEVEIKIYNEYLTADNALAIAEPYEIIVDATDSIATRYLINDVAQLSDKVWVYGSIYQFEGQVSVFNYKNEAGEYFPNYRDLYPLPPPPEMVPSCADGGVIGVLPGIIGSMQANEVIKLLTHTGSPLAGKLLLFDALTANMRSISFKKRKDSPPITALIDYEAFCGISTSGEKIQEITPEEFKLLISEKKAIQLIDVREREEREVVHIGGLHLPLGSLETDISGLDNTKETIIYCKSGARGIKATQILQEKWQFTNVKNLKGGISNWMNSINPDLQSR